MNKNLVKVTEILNTISDQTSISGVTELTGALLLVLQDAILKGHLTKERAIKMLNNFVVVGDKILESKENFK